MAGFEICREIVVVSLVNGGPPPCFLDENVYRMLVDHQSVDIQNLNISKHLTSSEIKFIKEIEKEPAHYKDFVIDNRYTGVISHPNLSDIIGIMLISIVTKPLMYLKEFFLGLELFGFGSILKNNVELLKELFVVTDNEVDVNFVVSALTANFSATGSKRRKYEELIFDYFQDMLISLEDGKVLDSRNRWRICIAMRVSNGLSSLKMTQLLPKQHPTYIQPVSSNGRLDSDTNL